MSQLAENKLDAIRAELLKHPMYKAIRTPEQVRVFMQHHVFAVWDFMTLLKRLQQGLTCTTLPWMPAKEAKYARFINEIVLGEETDEDGRGGYASHFELYLEAMREVGADTEPITRFIAQLQGGKEPLAALRDTGVPESVYQFVKQTLELAQHGELHEVCASFFFGREEIIPDMFQVLVDELMAQKQSVDRLMYYLNRHIELDGDEHGPLAQGLLNYLCGDDETRKEEAQKVAIQSLQARIDLWYGVVNEIEKR